MSAMVFVVVMLLLVVASNVATLVFARTWSRAPELAVRTALGAARKRVVGQLFFETLVLGSIAAGDRARGRILRAQLHQEFARGLAVLDHARAEPTHRGVRGVPHAAGRRGEWLVARVARDAARSPSDAASRAAALRPAASAAPAPCCWSSRSRLSVALLNGAVTMARAFESYIDEVPALPKGQVLTAQLGPCAVERTAPEDRDRRRGASRCRGRRCRTAAAAPVSAAAAHGG